MGVVLLILLFVGALYGDVKKGQEEVSRNDELQEWLGLGLEGLQVLDDILDD